MKVVICGSISVRSIPAPAAARIDRIIRLRATVLIGDAPGVDVAVQRYLHRHGYEDVRVYHAGAAPRNNVDGWPTVAVPGTYTDRDRRMCADAEYGLAIWNGTSPGTRRNVLQLGRRMGVVRA